MIYSNENIYEG